MQNSEELVTQLYAATDRSREAIEAEVTTAVRLLAAAARERFPEAKTIELDDSDQGDWLTVLSIDNDEDGVPLDWDDEYGFAASCIYTANIGHVASLTRVGSKHILDHYVIDIDKELSTDG